MASNKEEQTVRGASSAGRKYNQLAIPLNFGNLLSFSGGALAGVALLFAVRKLYCYMTAATKKPDIIAVGSSPSSQTLLSPSSNFSTNTILISDMASSNETLNRSDHSDAREQPDGSADGTPTDVNNEETTPVSASIPGGAGDNNAQLGCSPQDTKEGKLRRSAAEQFNDDIIQYYRGYVATSVDGNANMFSIVKSVRNMLLEGMRTIMLNHPCEQWSFGRCLIPQLHAIHINEISLIIPLKLDAQMWELNNGGDSIFDAHGFWLARRVNLEFFVHGSSPYDKYLTGAYFSPSKLRQALLAMCHRGLNWGGDYKVLPAVTGDCVTLQINHGNDFVTVNFIPSICVSGTRVLAVPHVGATETRGLENLWLQYCDYSEHITGTPAADLVEDDNTALVCMKVFSAIAQNHIECNMITDEMVISAVLHTLKQQEKKQTIASLLVASWTFMQESLEADTLTSFGCPERNLLLDHHSTMIGEAARFMRVVTKHSMHVKLLINRNV